MCLLTFLSFNQLLNERTEELQNGAQDFASMATELAKRMENRKWWQL